jgi:hypothetical protein
VWFMFVPKLVEFSESEITIATLLGEYSYHWDDLYSYGWGRGVFMIQFSGDRQAYQIFSGAYADQEWSKLTEFLDANYPDRKMAYSIGGWLFPKNDK